MQSSADSGIVVCCVGGWRVGGGRWGRMGLDEMLERSGGGGGVVVKLTGGRMCIGASSTGLMQGPDMKRTSGTHNRYTLEEKLALFCNNSFLLTTKHMMA